MPLIWPGLLEYKKNYWDPEQERKDLEHYFLHDHPLIDSNDSQQDCRCNACGLPLSSKPSYKCNSGCDFFLHKVCRQLPHELNYYATHGAKYSLALVAKPPNEAWTCDKCGKLCENLITYRSSYCLEKFHDERTFYVDALCAFPLEIKHASHEHELVVMNREAQLLCDACGEEHKGFFYSCKEYCDFWIHKDCAELPRIIYTTSHHHHLTLVYAIFGNIKFGQCHFLCDFCMGLFSRNAAYYCYQCGIFAHLNCAASTNKNSELQPVQLPLEEEEDKSLFICSMLNKKRKEKNEEDKKLSMEKYHKHPLIFHDKDSSSSSSSKYYSLQCNACIQPINSPPFYSCEEPGCDFLLHQHCTNLPSEIIFELFSSHKRLALKPMAEKSLSLFVCSLCDLPCNGFGYKGYTHKSRDVECTSLPGAIKHQLHHTQHILCLDEILPLSASFPYACCNRWWGPQIAYRCISCAFKIHAKCALLPAKVTHKFDKHPLQLSSKACLSTSHVNDSEHCFCEICEDKVDTEHWFYYCKECDQFFHIKCIPSVGLLSKIKFGGTLVFSCHPADHPLSITRMLDIGSQRCEICKQIIRGLNDAAAFQCSKCCYWIHTGCALDYIDSNSFDDSEEKEATLRALYIVHYI